MMHLPALVISNQMEKVVRERTKAAEKRERDRASGKKEKPADDDPGIGDFLRSAELVSPRHERLRDRDTIVFDFRPRVGYKPKGDIESIVSKLTGVVWIDPVDRQVMRLEARLIESYKMGGGLLASVRPGTAFVFEQKRTSAILFGSLIEAIFLGHEDAAVAPWARPDGR